MKKSRIISAVCALLMVPVGILPGQLRADAAVNVTLSPESTYAINDGVFEGWGTSLCWWANRVGYSDSLAQQTADAFYGENGLRLNIARFNIGGGDDPTHTHITRTDSNMPGYTVWNGSSATYDWSKDANQRNVLLRSIEACGDDMIVEMFSNSPPYYMCKSGCSTGNQNPGANNLKDDCYDDFAEYLAEVCYHYEHDWGVKVQSVEAFNEPYTNFWGAGSAKQEGCHFDIGNSESTMIMELQKSMQKRGLTDTMIVASDETSIDTQIDAYKALSADAKNAISRIDTHTYGGYKREELRNTALAAGKNLWMSEVDGGSTAGTNAGEMGAGLWLAERISTDMNGLNPSAWIIWQVIDNHISAVGMNGNKDKGMVNVQGGYWGTAVADHDNDRIVFTKKYYSFGQYTRYIRPGMTMLNTSGNTVAAYDPIAGQVVLVAYNTGSGEADLNITLSGFRTVGTSAEVIRTSNSENWASLDPIALDGNTLRTKLAGQSVTTYIINGCQSGPGGIALSGDQITGRNTDSEHSPAMAFDGDLETYYAGPDDGYVQADLGGVYDLSAISFCPAKGHENDMHRGMFEVSLDGKEWTTIHQIQDTPDYKMNTVKLPSGTKAKYIRYHLELLDGGEQYCSVAEIAVHGKLNFEESFDKLTPAALSGSEAWKNQEGYDYTKAFDGNTSTFFDGVGAGWVQADLGEVYDLRAVGYCPRSGYEYRMVDGYFAVSTDGETWETVYTVASKPGFSMQQVLLDHGYEARYVRYAVPEGTPNNGVNQDNVYCCNIAEVALYGLPVQIKPLVGDVDASKALGVSDVVMLQKYLLGIGSLEDADAGDLNGDDVIDIFDLALLKRALLK